MDTPGCNVNPNWGAPRPKVDKGGGSGSGGTTSGPGPVGSTAIADRNIARAQENNKKLFIETFSADNPFCQAPGMAGQCESMRNAVKDGYDPHNAWVSLMCGNGYGNTICMNELGYRWNCGHAPCPELLVHGGEVLGAVTMGVEVMGGRALLGGARFAGQPTVLSNLTKMASKGSGTAIDDANSLGLRMANAYCSFSGDTPVLMADGTTKPISEIAVGDEVLAMDPETGESGPREVTRRWVHEDAVVRLEVNGSDLTTTEDHPFWNATDRQWQRVDQLDRGDALLTSRGGTAAVGRIADDEDRGVVYNLTVASIHTYYVLAGNIPVLVHNTGPCTPDLTALSNSGQEIGRGGELTRAGLSYDKHMKRGQLQTVPGGEVDTAGQNLLDDILTDPRGVMEPVTGGNFNGGHRFIRPDGTGAIFDAGGTFQYFGQFRYPG